MSNIEINRDHTGKLHLSVAGQYASGANVSHMTAVEGELCAVVFVPLKVAKLGEVQNVIPFVAAEGK